MFNYVCPKCNFTLYSVHKDLTGRSGFCSNCRTPMVKKTAEEAPTYKVGDEVKFYPNDLLVEYGWITKVNTRTATVRDPYGNDHKVLLNKLTWS